MKKLTTHFLILGRKMFCLLLLTFCYSLTVMAQQSKVSGTVSSTRNITLPGVSVSVKGTKRGTLTGPDGQYAIQANTGDVLVFSLIGFQETAVTVGPQKQIDIKLAEANNDLNEVVVVGYGTMKKSDLSGSVSTINAKDISEKSYSNFQQFLSGKAPGVVVQEASGQPGAGLSIEIRGMSSISGSSQPLYVVDGMPFDAVEASSGSTYAPATTTNPLAAINPNDIASVEILKDASATAIYGSRGANGVVLITTKKGQVGTPRINMSYNHSLSTANFPIDRLNALDQALAVNEKNAARGFPIGYTADEMNNLQYYDHFEEISRTGVVRDLNAAVSGGSASAKYYISYQNYAQQGIYKSSGLSRNSIKANIESQLKKNLTARASVNYNRTVNTGFPVNPGFGTGLFSSALNYSPLVPMLNPDGSYNKLGDYKYGTELYVDPVFGIIYYNPRFNLQTEVLPNLTDEPANNTYVLMDKYKSSNTTQQFIGNVDLSYKLSKHLTLAGKVGLISAQTLTETYRPRALPVESTWKGQATIGNGQTKKLLYESTIAYNNSFGKHNINGVLGATAETYEIKNFSAENREFPNDITGYNNIGAGTVLLPPSSSLEENQLASFLGRFNYNYADKYLVTFTGRYDGSSRFSKGNKFGFFPSVAASWRVSKESFMKHITALSDLKFRASYGIIGNQAVGNYATLSTLSSGMNYGFGSIVNTGYAASRVPNPNLSWEESKQVNLGADLAVLNNRIRLSVDLYKKTTDKLLFNAQTPLTLGFATMVQNVGEMENKGLELVLTTINSNNALKWSTDFNIGFNKNKITRLNGNVEFLQNGSEIGGLTRSYLGKPIAEIYGYRTLPVWNTESLATKPGTFQPGVRAGDARYQDINNNNVLDDGDLVALGSALPKFTGGFGNNLSYKNFELNVFMSFSYGASAYNAFLARMSDVGGNNTAYRYFNTRYRDLTADMDAQTAAAVTANNAVTHFPKAGATTDIRTARDYNVEKTSYLRINSITLGYNIPRAFLERIKVQNVKIYTTLQNPWILTDYKGINPEGTASNTTINRGVDTGGYPLAKMVAMGINFTF